jgi:hypothetical protein
LPTTSIESPGRHTTEAVLIWIIAPRGFFSAVAKPDNRDGCVTLRARSEGDIRNLADLIAAEPRLSDHSDCRWRIR